MEIIKIDLKRKRLSDNFKVCDQEIDCRLDLSGYLLRALEAQVDNLCMQMECFSVSVVVELYPKVNICNSVITKKVAATIMQVLNYDMKNLLDKPIILKDF